MNSAFAWNASPPDLDWSKSDAGPLPGRRRPPTHAWSWTSPHWSKKSEIDGRDLSRHQRPAGRHPGFRPTERAGAVDHARDRGEDAGIAGNGVALLSGVLFSGHSAALGVPAVARRCGAPARRRGVRASDRA